MYISLLLILSPLFVGYLFFIQKQKYLKTINHCVIILVYIILFLIGFMLSKEKNLIEEISSILWYSFCFIICTQILSALFIILYDKFFPIKLLNQKTIKNKKSKAWKESIKIILFLFLGLSYGLLIKNDFALPKHTTTFVLMIMLFFIGIQLRSNNISIKEVFLNKRGITISILFVVGSLLGGAIASVILKLPLNQSLSIASGFGWYSLSSIVVSDAFGATMGSVALINDLTREILALISIPLIMKKYPGYAVGIGGATSLDFALPTIQRSGGIYMVPVAISFGFFINILAPIFLVFFSQM